MPLPVGVIYTGGTIGSRPKDPDPDSPQIVVPWEDLLAATPEVAEARIGFDMIARSTEPLDSCNVGPAEWMQMAEIIESLYDEVSGFVILHGTDTMTFTGSALSFMLRNLQKPVVLTGAQTSAMVNVRNDASQNFVTALMIANPEATRIPTIPEVCICFGGDVLRANRTIKRDTVGYSAYHSPNLPPLATVGDAVTVNQRLVLPIPDGKFSVRRRLDRHVLPLMVYPGIQGTDLAKRQLDDETLKAAVVMSFGSGNIPTDPDFIDVFRAARSQGVVMANVSQCAAGPVELGIYETSAELLEAGFVAANDITLEAALCKLMVTLGDPDLDADMPAEERCQIVERQFERSLAGEQSLSTELTNFGESAMTVDTAEKAPGRGRIRGMSVSGQFEAKSLDRALLRLRGLELESSDNSAVSIRIFVNLDPDAAPDDSDPGFAGKFRKWPEASSSMLVLDVTSAIRATVRPGDRVSFTIVVDSQKSRISWTSAELALLVGESA